MSNVDDSTGGEETESSTETEERKLSSELTRTNSAKKRVTHETTQAMELETFALQRSGVGKNCHFSKHVKKEHLFGSSSAQNNYRYIDDRNGITSSDTEIEDLGLTNTRTFSSDMCGATLTSIIPVKQVILDSRNNQEMQPSDATECNEDDSTVAEGEAHDDDITLETSPAASATDRTDCTTTSKRKRNHRSKRETTNGRWTPAEHQAFLQGLKVFGREWKKVAERIPTRTSAQIRSHAQKYFSKMQREESIVLQDQMASALQHSPSSTSSVLSIPDQDNIPPSVQRSVDRILANPHEVQREVEDTLRSLRERYHQLQMRLEETQHRQSDGYPSRPMSRIVEEPTENEPVRPLAFPLDRRKRFVEGARDTSEHNYQPGSSVDDMSSVSSTLSENISTFSPTRELGNEELIALHVLRGTLQHGPNHMGHPTAAASNGDTRMALAGSPASSLTSEYIAEERKEPPNENEDDDHMSLD